MTDIIERIAFDVFGTPAPKGSSRAMLTKSGKAVHVPSGSQANKERQKSWSSAVREAALVARADLGAAALLFTSLPLRATLIFRLRRPMGHYNKQGNLTRKAPQWPIGKPDKDKLFRATADALTGILFDDDSRIVETLERKIYAAPGMEGARIIIEAMSNAQRPTTKQES